MIYTSYYANHRKWRGKMITEYQISNTKPKWYTQDVDKYKPVIPPWDIVDGYKSGRITEAQFEERYLNQLNSLSTDDITRLKAFNSDEAILLCWEKADQFCHRHILRKFLNERGVQCKEYTSNCKEIYGEKEL